MDLRAQGFMSAPLSAARLEGKVPASEWIQRLGFLGCRLKFPSCADL
jgi:hypothetical protein